MNQKELFALADTLQMQLNVDEGRVQGKTDKLPGPLIANDKSVVRIVSSVSPPNGVGVIAHFVADLGIFVGVAGDPMKDLVSFLSVLDVGQINKEGGGAQSFFEALSKKPTSVLDAIKLMKPYARATFRRIGTGAWTAFSVE